MSDEKDYRIARLRSLVRDLYADLIEYDESCSSWPVEKYAIRVDGEGIDVSELGAWRVGKEVKLYKQLERQELDSGDKYGELKAQEYRAQYERLIAVAHTVGMELEVDA